MKTLTGSGLGGGNHGREHTTECGTYQSVNYIQKIVDPRTAEWSGCYQAVPTLNMSVIHETFRTSNSPLKAGCCCCCRCCWVTSVVSNSVRLHRRHPTRLPRPWDSPGKNTGVGCHFLLQCMQVKSESEVAQSCLTPSDPVDCSLPGSSIHGTFPARVLAWVAIAFSVQSRIRKPSNDRRGT